MWSVRSTTWTVILMVVLVVGFGALVSWGIETNIGQMPPEDRRGFDATGTSLVGVGFGQLAFVVLGVLLISSEYRTGGIRSSLVAVPRRMRLLAAKALVLAAVTFSVGTVTAVVAFVAGQAFLADQGIEARLSDPGVLRAVVGGGLYLMASALFGFALGALIRHAAGAITLAIALLLVVPPLTGLLPGTWGAAVQTYFTSNAGRQIMATIEPENALSPWAGYAVFTLWWIVILAAAATLLQRRDA